MACTRFIYQSGKERMRDFSVLIKPFSNGCNMNCEYCFYQDVSDRRCVNNRGLMREDILEEIIKKSLAYAAHSCTFAFQGGEPTLAGIEFYKKCIEIQKKHAGKIRIFNSIQTNGYALDEEWAVFWGQNHFLVGISLDGIMRTHDFYRKDKLGNGTFQRVMNAISLLKKCNVEFNILTVVTGKTALKIRKIYEFYKKNDFKYLQFIPCLEAYGSDLCELEYTLSPITYGRFLIELFELWYTDVNNGVQPYIRLFENYVNILLGLEPYACDQKGRCSCQYVIEADGSVYPCDFYALDEYEIGNIKTHSIKEMEYCLTNKKFIDEGKCVPDQCLNCGYYMLCRGGCRRNYVDGINFYCESYKMFFSYAYEKLYKLAMRIRNLF